MSEFSQLLTDYVHRKDVRIYSLAEYCGIDRSLMYKIIHGKRMPSSAGTVDKISEFLRLTPAEHRELHTAFRISLEGRNNYYRRLDILDFLDHFRDIITPGIPPATSPAFHFSDCPNIPLSTFTEVRQATYMVLSTLTADDHPRLRLMLPPKSWFIIRLLSPLMDQKCSASIDHIMCLNNSEQVTRENQNYNLHCLRNILPLCICGCNYHPYFYYDNIDSRLDSFQLFPYLILTDKYAVLISDNFEKGLLTRQSDLLLLFQDLFSGYLSQARPLLKTITSVAEQLQFVREFIVSEQGTEYFFQMIPCMTHLLTEEFLKKYLHPDLPEKDLFIRNVLNHISDLEQRLEEKTVINIFSEDGIEEFLRTGIFEEYPRDIYLRPTLEDRLDIIRRFTDQCRAGILHIKMLRHNIGTVKNGANIYITPKAGYLLFTPIDSRSPVYLNIRESGLTAAFWDFFQSMDESLFYTTEEAILKLEDLIRKYQKG